MVWWSLRESVGGVGIVNRVYRQFWVVMPKKMRTHRYHFSSSLISPPSYFGAPCTMHLSVHTISNITIPQLDRSAFYAYENDGLLIFGTERPGQLATTVWNPC